MDVDLQVEVAPGGPETYAVLFRDSTGGETSGVLQLPPPSVLAALAARVPDAVLASTAQVRRAVVGDEGPVRELGQLLFEALLVRAGAGQLRAARHRAAERGTNVRLILRVNAPELAVLPWEFMYDPDEGDYLGHEIPLVRYPQVARPVAPLRVGAPLRILCMIARPDDLVPLDTQHEAERLQEALADLVDEGRVELGWVAGQTWRALRDAVRRDARGTEAGGRSGSGGPWHVLHFIGHGAFDSRAQEGTLALAGEHGGTHYLGATQLAVLLAGHPSLRLAVLNACETARSGTVDPFSSVAGALMRKGMPAVLAMRYPITDASALECARTFYEGLARQLPIDVAVMEARQAMWIAQRHSLEWGTPVLHMRSLDGVLFNLTEAPTQVVPVQNIAVSAVEASAFLTEASPKENSETSESSAAEMTPPGSAPITAVPAETVARDVEAEAFPKSEAVAVPASPDALGSPRRAADPPTLPPRPPQPPPKRAKSSPARFTAERIAQHTLPHKIQFAALNPQGDLLALAFADNAAMIINPQGQLVRSIPANPRCRIYQIAFSPDGRLFATAGSDHFIRVWETTGDEIWRARHSATVCAVAFSPDGRLVAGGAADGSTLVCKVPNGEAIRKITSPNLLLKAVNSVAFAPDGTRILVGDVTKWARIYDVLSGKGTLQVRHGEWGSNVHSVAFAQDGRQFVTCGDGNARLWDAQTAHIVKTFPHTAYVSRVALSPDGRYLATGTLGNHAYIWNVRNGKKLLQIDHEGPVTGVSFSGDSRLLATASADMTCQFWQLRR
ncbi:CHAT domain-containing WD40 repeat protein [Yinghuangia soli]|uniref:CHAT domain-containing protein n=1 Tax=Yinghuangia soli TaxID=2908204 RepID=A0AA41Q4W0_9ACTN|nr:CHAT domain-containing protein [Yinghuangia soli]MCF2531386.1 CHAT domain-containing protein [Yinghuangia soli]